MEKGHLEFIFEVADCTGKLSCCLLPVCVICILRHPHCSLSHGKVSAHLRTCLRRGNGYNNSSPGQVDRCIIRSVWHYCIPLRSSCTRQHEAKQYNKQQNIFSPRWAMPGAPIYSESRRGRMGGRYLRMQCSTSSVMSQRFCLHDNGRNAVVTRKKDSQYLNGTIDYVTSQIDECVFK